MPSFITTRLSLLPLALFLMLAINPTKAQQPALIDQVVAVVGKNAIFQSDIENQYIQLRLQRGISGSASEIRCGILEDMLFQKLMLNQAELDSITVTDDQVEQEMERRLRYFINELGSQEKLESYYNKTIVEIKNELRRMVKDQMLGQKVQEEIMSKVVVTPQEVRQHFKNLAKDSIPVVPAEYEIAQIVKRPPVSVEEKMEIKEKLNGLRKRILAGERFSTLAILYSEDPGSAKKGGELGFYGRGELYPEFEAVAFKLREGEVSEIVETQAGFHIIQMIGRRGDYVNVRHILMMTKVSPHALEKAKNELDSLLRLIRIDSITFEKAVEKFSDEENKNTGGFLLNAYTGGVRFEAEALDPQVSFVIEKLKPGEISEPVPMKTEDGKDAYRLLKLMLKTTPHQANLKDDYNRIAEWALSQKKQKSVNEWIRSKSKNAFVNIHPEYQQCHFEFNWKNE